ncbi:FZD8 protein, partial [Oxyruncus cristatus]|nr:FZD8 protein [Oxyruncus cristatus]
SSAKELSCQEITVPLCKGIGYNYTYMPNQFNHDTQDEAGLEVHQFWPLVEIQCSPDLRFFLCSMYTPICLEDYKKPLPPCRSVCERAKAGCAPLMRQYGFAWPDRMRCDRLPEQGSPDTLCMDYNRTDLTTAAPPPAKPPVAGICYVGNQSLENLRGFVLAPLLIYLAIGSMFLLAGFVSLFRIRSVIKQQGGPTKTHKLEKLMIRLGLFTVLYTVPAASVVACLFYEQHNRPRWEATHNCPCLRDQQPDQARRPDYAVFMLKYFMCLVVGITSGVWVWSGKTLESWR